MTEGLYSLMAIVFVISEIKPISTLISSLNPNNDPSYPFHHNAEIVYGGRGCLCTYACESQRKTYSIIPKHCIGLYFFCK